MIIHSTDKGVAEKPKCNAIRQRNGEISIAAGPAVRALKQAIVFQEAPGVPIAGACSWARQCQENYHPKSAAQSDAKFLNAFSQGIHGEIL